MEELIVLVDDKNEVIGSAPKLESHHANTPLHRAFSCFLFGADGRLLLQQRSGKKKTWPLVWTNSFCGHPLPDEPLETAIQRRMRHELGIGEARLCEVLPEFRYKAEFNGVVENEICPVFVAFSHDDPKLNPDEVEAIRWVPWTGWLLEVEHSPLSYSYWCVLETRLLEQSDLFHSLIKKERF